MATKKEPKLTDQMKAFADAYLGPARFHITNAALLANYSKKTAYAIGSDVLKKPQVRQYINERLAENCLSANRVLSRLADIANGSIEDLLDEDGNFDFKAAKKAGKLSLVKKLKRKTSKKTETAEEGESSSVIETEDVEFEMYSSHEALRDLGKYHKLFVERHQVEGNIGHYVMTKEEWERETEERLKQVNSRLKDSK